MNEQTPDEIRFGAVVKFKSDSINKKIGDKAVLKRGQENLAMAAKLFLLYQHN